MDAAHDSDPDAAARMRRDHARAYAQRMNRVLDHIDAHLDSELALPALAAVANFSPFHFHRLFAAWMGETLGDYLRRRRLESAAVRLAASPDAGVLDVALGVGFGSGEAFARAFKQRFGMTPSAWRAATPARWAQERQAFLRRHRNPDQATAAALADDAAFFDKECPMDVSIENLPAARVAYLRHIGPYGQAVNAFWLQTVLPWLIEHGLETAPRYGIGLDDPLVTPAANCRYDACVAVPDDFAARSPAAVQVIPGGRCAVLDFEGTVPELEATYVTLLRDWLPASGLQPDNRPLVEYYPPDARYDPERGAFQCRLCLAIKPA